MIRTLLVSLLVLAVSVPAFADCSPADKKALEDLDRAWGAASAAGDRAALERLYADDFMDLTPGNAADKARTIASTMETAAENAGNPDQPAPSYDHYIIHCTPNTAVITHRNVVTTVADGKKKTTYGRSIHVAEKRNGRWQVITTTGHAVSGAAELLYKEAEWSEADVRGDVAWFERNLADDYIGISSRDGKMSTKAQEIAELRTRRERLNTAWTSDLDVQMHGDVGIVTGIYHVSGRDESGKPFDRKIRFIDTYSKRNGDWQVVSSQGTRIADEK